MSHFFTLVLVPEGTPAVKAAVAYLLAPFDQNLEVHEDEVLECDCVHLRAFEKAELEAASRFGGIDQLRERFAAEYVLPEENEGESDRCRQKAWTEFVKDKSERYEDRTRILLKSAGPDPECEDCAGTGVITTWHNSDTQWDSWQIGGRWTGVFTDYDPEADPKNLKTCSSCGGTGTYTNLQDGLSSECHQCNGSGQSIKWPTHWAAYEGDTMPARNLHLTTYPDSVVTPDGEWHHSPGWVGCTLSDVDHSRWKEHVDALLQKYCDCVAVVVDCHI
jgi:hypothetical protein